MKINMDKKESLLIIIGILLFLFVAGFVGYSLFFLAREVNTATEANLSGRQQERINFEALKKIGVMK